MIKSHEQEKITTEVVVDDIICNCCEKPIKKDNFTYYGTLNPTKEFEDCLEINKEWGYLSDYDCEIHSFHICQSCYKKWIDSFKIPIDIEEVEY